MPSADDVNPDAQKEDVGLAISTLLNLIGDYHDFNPDTNVPVFPYPTDLQFSQQVARSRPCVYHLDRSVLNTKIEAVLNTKIEAGNETNGATPYHGRGKQRQSSSLPLEREPLSDEQRLILSAPCFQWTRNTFRDLLDGEVEVAVTPDGRADSLYALPTGGSRQGSGCSLGEGDRSGIDAAETVEQVFLQPVTTRMTMSNLLDELCPPPSTRSSDPGSSKKPVYYLQSQDSNLSRPELSSLVTQLPETPPPFALALLGDPEATNIWIGNAQSVTTTHRDPYENLYLVVKGRKKFVLYAPVEEICLHAQMVRTGKWTYDEDTGKFDIAMDSELSTKIPSDEQDNPPSENSDPSTPLIPWIPIDPLNPPTPSSSKYPFYKYARPLTVTVNEGEILYLPAGWFHHVSQECGEWEDEDGNLTPAPCIAVNYWFDMDYSGEKHVMREMVGRLVDRVRLGRDGER